MNKLIIGLLILSNSVFSQVESGNENNSEKSPYVIGGSVNILVQNNSYPFSTFGITSGIGGLGGIYSNSLEDIKNVLYSFNPYLGYDINPLWTMGVQMNLRFGDYKINDVDTPGQPNVLNFTRKSTQIGFGLFARRTYLEDSKFNLFLQPNISYNILTEEEEYDNISSNTEKARYMSMALGMGAIYNINARFRITARMGGISYTLGSWEVEGTANEKDFNTFQTNLSLSSVFLGLEIKL